MKIFYRIFIFLILYALLTIPDNRSQLHIPEKNSLEVSSKWWGKFAQNLVKFRITNSEYQEYYYEKHRNLLNYHLDELLLQLAEPGDPILDSISHHVNKLSTLASLAPHKINEFHGDVARWRKLLKYQSRYWDTSSESTNQRIFHLITESRLAFESALIQSNTASATLSTIQNIDGLKSVTIENLEFKSGDIVSFNLAYKQDPFVSFIKELPNVYQHLGCVHITDTSASVVYIDHEEGIKIVALDKFIGEIAPNGITLRLRDDIPAINKNPHIPALAATDIYSMASGHVYEFDYNFDSDTQFYLYDWELINTAYKAHDLNLEPSKFVSNSSSIHLGNPNSHLNAFEIELDHRFVIAGEWYNTQQLYNKRILTAATSSIMHPERVKTDFIDPFYLPLYRIMKAYSMIIGIFGFEQPIPSGVTAQAQLVYNNLIKEQEELVERLTLEISSYEKKQNHKATYLKMLQKSNEIKDQQLADLK